MDTVVMNQEKTEAFAGRMVNVLNEGALGLLCSIGYRTKLFDVMARLPPATSAQIAEASGLNERYVREWLNGLVTGRVVDYDPDIGTYHLPLEHAAWLTRAAGADNLALYTQYIACLGSVEDEIVECFQYGGGVPYSAYRRFHEVMAEDSGINIVEHLLDKILPVVPGLKARLEAGIEVLDVGCGRGRALLLLAQAFPNSRFTGLDFSKEAIDWASSRARQLGLSNVQFVLRDAALIDERDRYDLITSFDAIHDQANPARVLSNIARALKRSGVYLAQDIASSSRVEANLDNDFAPFLYTISTMHCMTVSLAYDGDGLGTMWGKEKALSMLANAGFRHTEVHQLPHDLMNYYYISSK